MDPIRLDYSDEEWEKMKSWLDRHFNEPDEYTLDRMTEACLYIVKQYNTYHIPLKMKNFERSMYLRNPN